MPTAFAVSRVPLALGVALSELFRKSFYPAHNIFYRLCVRSWNDFERTIAYRAVPKMTDLPLIPVLGPLRGNQVIVALHAICTEARTTFGCYHPHGGSPAVASK
jgi:hypothetical protein